MRAADRVYRVTDRAKRWRGRIGPGPEKGGVQSTALLVVREAGGYGGDNDGVIDLRVDYHPGP